MMWVVAMFDLPTRTPRARKDYAAFRRRLLTAGFLMLQKSVYARHCATPAVAEVQGLRIEGALPAAGDVRILAVTDQQFGRMRVFLGSQTTPVERPPGQLEMF